MSKLLAQLILYGYRNILPVQRLKLPAHPIRRCVQRLLRSPLPPREPGSSSRSARPRSFSTAVHLDLHGHHLGGSGRHGRRASGEGDGGARCDRRCDPEDCSKGYTLFSITQPVGMLYSPAQKKLENSKVRDFHRCRFV
ncbi:hypothetical protein BD311DRAFT_759516, partial [Dichomitus squalens]